jgi:hypothetical protein
MDCLLSFVLFTQFEEGWCNPMGVLTYGIMNRNIF